MNRITSRDNQKLKNARKVRDGKIKDKIFVEGLKLLEEAIKSNLKISQIFLTEKSKEDLENLDFLKGNLRNLDFVLLSEKLLKSISDTKSPQGVIAICEKPSYDLDTLLKKLTTTVSIPIIILLHKVNNPSNVGAIFRNVDASGAIGIITTENSADAFSTKATRAAMGSNLRVPIVEKLNFDEAIDWAKLNNLRTICADINSNNNYSNVNWNKPSLLVFGSEASGLTASEREQIKKSVYIPMEENVESLNLAVSSGIILFEARKQFFSKS